jgi:predicted O-methyltransferase YrrM
MKAARIHGTSARNDLAPMVLEEASTPSPGQDEVLVKVAARGVCRTDLDYLKAEVRAGDAVETLAHDLPDAIDFVLLDGAKGLYIRILSLLEKRLRAGALVIADNVDLCPTYAARVRAPGSGYLSLRYQDGLEPSMKTN